MLIENFRPGVLDRLGFSAERLAELNPRLVILSITGFGHDGPEGSRPGYDQIAQGEGGLMSLTGPSPDQPTRVGAPVADIMAGMYGVSGVLAALVERDRTGRGQVVRTSLLAAVVGSHAYLGTRYTVAGEVARAARQLSPVDLPVRPVSGGRRVRPDRGGHGRAVAAVRRPAFGLAAPKWKVNRDRVADHVGTERRRGRRLRRVPGRRRAAPGWPSSGTGGKVRDLAEVYDWEQTRSQGLVIERQPPRARADRAAGAAAAVR